MRLVKGSGLVSMFIVTAGLSFYGGRQTAPSLTVKMENDRVAVVESVSPPGARRESYIRPSDQVLVFLDDARYDVVDASGTVEARTRKRGDIVWHTKGEVAPLLINRGPEYRNVIIALK